MYKINGTDVNLLTRNKPYRKNVDAFIERFNKVHVIRIGLIIRGLPQIPADLTVINFADL